MSSSPRTARSRGAQSRRGRARRSSGRARARSCGVPVSRHLDDPRPLRLSEHPGQVGEVEAAGGEQPADGADDRPAPRPRGRCRGARRAPAASRRTAGLRSAMATLRLAREGGRGARLTTVYPTDDDCYPHLRPLCRPRALLFSGMTSRGLDGDEWPSSPRSVRRPRPGRSSGYRPRPGAGGHIPARVWRQ